MERLINITINYPINTPNRNGTVFTHDAVRKAFSDMQTKRQPMIDYTQDDRGKVVGITTSVSCYWTEDNCMINNKCFLFDRDIVQKFDTEIMVNKSHKDQDGTTVIDDFRIMSVSVVED